DERAPGVLGRIARKEKVERVVVGLPLLLDGREGEQAKFSRSFAARLAGELEVPVEFFDERLSSAQAKKTLMDAGVKPARRKRVSDMIAAALILRDYIEAIPRKESAQENSSEDGRETIE
ncbi:MAG: Holliday junction resolvase RuvX, partial [Actinomycetota bacterium]|nr:Holliday junction resolvase RuvX [Actinomycetota bacterium]